MVYSKFHTYQNNMYFYFNILAHFLNRTNKNTMMNWNKKLLILLIALMFFPFPGHAEEIPQNIVTGFSTGNESLISGYFKNTIELSINATENVYSSTQAEIILKDFFKKNPPTSFKVIHKGGQGESRYAIGSLTTSEGDFRITLLIKSTNNKPYIHQLRIEKDGV